MLDFLYLPPLLMQIACLILYTVICGHHLYSVFLVISTIWSWLMISPIILGLSLCASNLRRSPRCPTSLPGCPLSLASPLRPPSVTTGVSSITMPPALSSSLAVSSCTCPAPTPPLRTARLSA
ncbi:hypothetical protein BS78_03G225800 [Paspalum vaginatum]|nr:hypothetical protein BS78_03G225800 [Paspalum vaginatum]